VVSLEDAARRADVLSILAADEAHKEIWETKLAPHARAGQCLMFCHGFSVDYGLVDPPEGFDVVLAAAIGGASGYALSRYLPPMSGSAVSGSGAQTAALEARIVALESQSAPDLSGLTERVSRLESVTQARDGLSSRVDTLAASLSATNVILLGDPQQLPQVAKASHPNRSGVSALEHLLGEDVHTFPLDRGVLLDVTWRMHPDVCGFISDVMYEGKLTSEASCTGQTTAAGTGLRWIRAEHEGHAMESPEEAAIVVDTIAGLIGSDWTDQEGVTRPLTIEDFIVVAPYNDQVRLIREVFSGDERLAGVEVGTVDKFQGREAAVVLFSMTTSSSAHMPRNADFLFSKNRLNVAISRARCLAFLICTDELLDTRARTVEEMELVSALCSFVERAT
jgi:hypothetical protein